MRASVPDVTAGGHLSRLEGVRPTMAKADLKTLETHWRERIGKAIARCFKLADVSQKEGAGLLDRDPGQIARWISGGEPPQLNAILAVPQLRQHFLIALAEVAGEGIAIETTIRIVRTA